MLWFAVWTVLALGAVGALFLATRSAYRKGVLFLGQLSHAAEVTARLADRLEELTELLEQTQEQEQAHAAATRTQDDPFGAHAARDRRAELQVLRDRRRADRADRHEQTYERWRSLTGLP